LINLRGYTMLLYLLIPLVLLRLLWKGVKAPLYLRRWPERFGFFPDAKLDSSIWIHAVSVGETQSALPLIRELLAKYPQMPLVVTTTTPTGSRRVVEALGDKVAHCYFPYDLPGAVHRVLERINPRLLLVMETELWPNLYQACARRAIPLVVMNARLSLHSERRYRWFGALIGKTLGNITLVAAQSDTDAGRFIGLGADPARVSVIGNLKFDLEVPEYCRRAGRQLRHALGEQRPVWAAVSTHRGEEDLLLQAFATVRESVSNALLLLVPRHPERFPEVGRLCERRGWQTRRRSRCEAAPQTFTGADIYLGDTMGEVLVLLAASDVAFVGGSLVPIGGHNVMEPAALGVPVCFGPHMHNFVDAGERLLQGGAGWRINDASELAAWVQKMFADPDVRKRASQAGRHVVTINSGALRRLMAAVSRLLEQGV
jgi:3-deoxy-D-manno-octulosonic-acid transferase